MWLGWLRGFFILTAVGLGAFLAMQMVGQIEFGSPSSSLTLSEKEPADAKIEKFSYMRTQSGRVQWKVEAQTAQVYESQKQAILKDVLVRMYQENGKELTLVADRGTIDMTTNDFDLEQETRVVTIDLGNGYTGHTKHLRWVEAQKEIITQDPVTIYGRGLKVTGGGLVGRLDPEKFRILKNVRVEIGSNRVVVP